MPNLIERFQQFIKKNGLFQTTDQLLVAVSGGVDSIVLTHLLRESGYIIHLAHCNFGLRDIESNHDEQLVRDLSIKMGVTCHIQKMDTKTYADKKQISIQMAARDLRYQWFAELMSKEKYDLLTTAHHANDQVETILFNLTKGTGIAGLRGIKPINESIVRPLLFANKDEILAYAKNQQLVWREDASNQSDKYHRNRIRNQVIPVLKEINPSLEDTILNSTARFNSLELLLNTQVEQIKKENLTGNETMTLSLSWLNVATGGLVILEEILKCYGFNLPQCEQIIEAETSGKRFYSSTHALTLDRNQLLISSLELVLVENTMEYIIPAGLSPINIDQYLYTFQLVENKANPTNDPNSAYLDFDQLTFPLKARHWKEGDRFTPLGMKGQKKISDFMIDEKIPVNLKRKLVLFESQGEIIWIAGHRISDGCKITSKTTRTLIIQRTENAKSV